MLEVYLTRNSKQGVWLQLPSTPEEQREAFADLDAIESEVLVTRISDVRSSAQNLTKYVCGSILDDRTLAELTFLSKRVEWMNEGDRVKFNGALEIEKPQNLQEIVNLSCNLENFTFHEGISTEEELGKYLLNRAGNEVPKYLASLLEYEYIGNKYAQSHMGCFCEKGYVIKIEDELTVRYDEKHLPDPFYEIDSPIVLDVRMNGTYVSLYLPVPESRLDLMEKRLGFISLDERAQFSSKENVKGLYSRLPCGASVRELNDLAGVLQQVLNGTGKNRDKVLAVLEAEAPATVKEAIDALEQLQQYDIFLALDDFTEPSDYVFKVMEENTIYYLDGFTADFVDFEALCKAMMKQEGAVLTTYGIVVREDGGIRQLPEELDKFRLFSPLAGRIYRGEEPDLITPYEIYSYEAEIRQAVERDKQGAGEGRGLAVRLDNEILKRKVFSMKPSVETWNDELWGVLEVEVYGSLTNGEMEMLKDAWAGQCADGWGEDFEQRPINTEEGEIYISFWQQGEVFSIKTESELKGQPEQVCGFEMQ